MPVDLKYIIEIEGLLFNDVRLLLGKAREAHKNIEEFRQRTLKDQENLQGYLRAVVTAIFHFIEAYLNGLAYDCFQLHHGQLSIDDHDLLGEWNSDQKRIRYISFNKKLFTYPVIVAGVEGMQVDVSNCEPANLLATEGKRVRDAFTHPSYYIDPKTGFQERLHFLTGANLSLVELIFNAAKEYVTFVEVSLGRDPRQSAPWLLE